MQIIDKNKDYYDHCQFEFGPVDKTTTFDRRGSKAITKKEFFRYCYKNELSFRASDGKLIRYAYYGFRGEKEGQWFYWRPDHATLVLLEVGNIQYVLELKNTRDMWINKTAGEFTIMGDVSILHRFDEGVHLCQKPVTLTHFGNKNIYNWRSGNTSLRSALDIDVGKDTIKGVLENPILKNTPIPSVIPARDFYNAIDNYLRSMFNDKTIEIKNSDIDKAINHGFDKRTSFRHPVK